MTKHWAKILERMPPFSRPGLAFIGAGCSEERYAVVVEFFRETGKEIGAERQLERVGDQVRDCVRLRAREGKAVAEYLKESR